MVVFVKRTKLVFVLFSLGYWLFFIVLEGGELVRRIIERGLFEGFEDFRGVGSNEADSFPFGFGFFKLEILNINSMG